MSDEPRVQTYDRDGVPHDDVLRTKSGKIITEEDIDRWAEEAAEGHELNAKILDAEIDQDAEWLRQASGEDRDYGLGFRWSRRSGRSGF